LHKPNSQSEAGAFYAQAMQDLLLVRTHYGYPKREGYQENQKFSKD